MNIAFSALVQIKVVTGKFCNAVKPLQLLGANWARCAFESEGIRGIKGIAQGFGRSAPLCCPHGVVSVCAQVLAVNGAGAPWLSGKAAG